MDRRRGVLASIFLQTRALLVKNALLSWRNLTATALQLGASFLFIFLIWCIQEAINLRLATNTTFQNLTTPPVLFAPAIPACETGYFMTSPCYDLLWSGNDSAVITSLVQNMSANNPGRPFDFATKTLGFATPADVDVWLLANPFRALGAIHFVQLAGGGIGYGLQTNSTAEQQRGIYQDPTFFMQVPLQVAAERELARHLTQDWGLTWNVTYSQFPHPASHSFSAVGSIGPTFLFAAAMFSFVTQMSNLVGERELKLRQAMATMGLLDTAYWASWLLWEMLLSLISSLALIVFGMIFRFAFFLKNDFPVLLFMFFLFQLSMISVAFLLSTFINKLQSATTTGFLVFIIGFVTQLVVTFGFPYSSTFSPFLRVIWSLFPPNLFAIGLQYLGDATAGEGNKGIKWGQIGECNPASAPCALTMSQIFLALLASFFVYFLLALYCDNVFPDANGIRKWSFFFMTPSFWMGKERGTEGRGCCSCPGRRLPPLPPPEGPIDDDVAQEEASVREEATSGVQREGLAVSVWGLVKSYRGDERKGGCCGCCGKRSKAFHALKGTWFNVAEGQLFCLLGPNGAGKSTTINALTGVIPPTGGNALIYGKSINGAMGSIRTEMGVCPQFDILWSELTGVEHLWLFAVIKGLPNKRIGEESAGLLKQVRLEEAGKVRAGRYSGGMKRRLSVAIALIGDPKIVFLDEPTTGMDPVTRRHVWDVIEGCKAGRCVLLTTHSMEEADILGDRIAIMAKGRLRCIGTALHLKKKFGAGFVISMGVRDPKGEVEEEEVVERRREGVKDLIRTRLGVEAADENKAYIKFLIPRSEEAKLRPFFLELKERKREIGITDVQLSLSTLEEVFLNIAAQAELENAQEEGKFDAVTLPDGRQIQVPIGAPQVVLPDSQSVDAPQGLMVSLTWQQDESGGLRVAHCSPPGPVPPTARVVGSFGGVGAKAPKGVLVGLQVALVEE